MIDWGWGDPRIIALLALFVVLIASFVAVERRAGEHALVPPDVMRNRDFAYTCGAILMMSAVFFAAMLYLPQLMINVLGYSPIGAGAGMLPMMATFAAVSFVAGNLYNRFGAKPLLILGSACIALGPALIALLADKETLRRARSGDGDPRPRDRALLPDRDHGRGHRRATSHGAASPARSSTCSRSPAGRSGLGLTTTVFIGASDRAQSGSGFIDGIQTAFTMDAAIAVGGFLIAAFLIGGRVKLPAAPAPACSPATRRAATGPEAAQLGPEPPPLVGPSSEPLPPSPPPPP